MKKIIVSLILLVVTLHTWALSPHNDEWKEKIIREGRKELLRMQKENAYNNTHGLSDQNHYVVLISPAASYPDGDFIRQVKGAGRGAGAEAEYILDQTTLSSLDSKLHGMNSTNEIDSYLLVVNFMPLEFVNEIPDDVNIKNFFRGKKTDLVASIAGTVSTLAGEIVEGITSQTLSKVKKPTLYCGFVNFKVFKNSTEGLSQWVYYPNNSKVNFDVQYQNILNGFVRNYKWPKEDFLKISSLVDLIDQSNTKYKDVKNILATLMQITDPNKMKDLIYSTGTVGLTSFDLKQRVHALKVLSSGSLGNSREIQILNLIKTAPAADYRHLLDSLITPNRFSTDKESLLKCIVGKTDDEHLFWGDDNYLELIKTIGSIVKAAADIDSDTGDFIGDPELNKKLVWDKSYALGLFKVAPVGTNSYSVKLMDNGFLDVTHKYVTALNCQTYTQGRSEKDYEECNEVWSSETEVVLNPFDLIGFVNRSDLAILNGVSDEDAKVMLVPALMLKYAQDKKFNANSAAAFFMTLDVVTILVPMTKVYNLAKITQRIYLGLDLAAAAGSLGNLTVNLLNDDPAFDKVVKKYNLIMGAINIAALAGGTRLAADLAGEFVTEVNQPGIKEGLKKLAGQGNKNANEVLALEGELQAEGKASGQIWATPINHISNNVDEALGIFYSGAKDKILLDVVEEAVIANDQSRLLRMFGLDKTLIGKSMGCSGKAYELTASNIFKGEELGKYPQYSEIKYFDVAERVKYEVKIKDGELLINNELLKNKDGKIIFVMDDKGRIYSGVQQTGILHHSSFLSGADVTTAGEFKFTNGILEISASSGHYVPEFSSLKSVIQELTERGFDINKVKVNKGF